MIVVTSFPLADINKSLFSRKTVQSKNFLLSLNTYTLKVETLIVNFIKVECR